MIKQATSPDVNKRKGISLLWSSRGVSLYISFYLAGYLSYYCTDHLGLSIGVVGTLFLIGKIIDTISNFIIAYYVDNSHFKLGKGRPFEICIIPLYLCIILAYVIPTSWSAIAQYIVVFILYNLINAVFCTFLNCVDLIYFNHAFKDENQRTSIQTVNGILQVVASSVAMIVLPILVGQFEHQPHGWLILSLIVSIPCMILGMVRFLTIPEVDTEETSVVTERVTIADTFKGLTTNKYVIIIALATFAIQMLNVISGSGANYYFTYIVGDISKQSIINAVALVSALGLLVYIPLSKKIGMAAVLRISFVVECAGVLIRLFAGDNMVLLMISSVLAGQLTFPFMIFGMLMLIDCMDYGEFKNGKRLEAAIFAGYSLGATIGNGVGSSVSGLIMEAAGYDGLAEVQSASALRGIVISYGLVPAIISVIMIIVLMFYDLDKKIPDIRAQLQERHQKASSEGADA